jgi:DNA-binding FrmR family transcriptional regulator
VGATSSRGLPKAVSNLPNPTVQVHHHTHKEIVKRLRRAEGHLRSIVTMIEEGRSCLSVAQQLHAVEKAVSQAKRTFIHDHLDDCLEHSVGSLLGAQRDSLEEFKEITKYL